MAPTTLQRTLFMLLIASRIGVAQSVVHVQVSGGVALAPVQVEGQTLKFLIDSGSETSSIDSQTATILGLSAEAKEQIQKNFRDIVVDVVEIPEFSIAGSSFKHMKVVELNLAPLAGAVGIKVDGVLGNDVLEQLVFRLNYSREQMVIEPAATLWFRGTPIRLQRDHGQYLIPTRLVSTPVDLVLDTGTNSTNISWSTWEKVTSSWKPGKIVEGIMRAGNPTSPAILVCLPEIHVGGMVMRDQAVRAQTKSDEGAFSGEDFSGILGADFLRQFEVGFDLKHDRIFLERDPGYKPDPYRYVTLGIQIGKNNEGSYQIMSVWKNSPASEAGLQRGDLLKAINREPISTLKPDEILHKLHGKEGTAIELTTERDGQTSSLTLRTRKMICGH